MAAIPFINKISDASTQVHDQEVISVDYGDGFEQVWTWGENSERKNWTLEWNGLSLADRNTFVLAYNRVTVFDWQAPGDSVTKQWRFDSPLREKAIGNKYILTASIKQVYVA